MLRVVVTLSLLVALVSGNVVRTVTLHEDTPWEHDDDQLEEFPPPQDWFRVRGGPTRTQALSHGDADVIVLDSRTRGADQNAQISPRSGDGGDRQIQVQVRSRGRVGFQDQEGRAQESFSRRRSEDQFDETLGNLPTRDMVSSLNGNSQSRQENWHLPIRHEGGRHRVNVHRTQSQQVNAGNRRQNQVQVPREPEAEEFSTVNSGNSRSRGRGDGRNVIESRTGSSSTASRLSGNQDDYQYDYADEDDQVVNQNAKNVIRKLGNGQQLSGQLQSSRRNDDDVVIILDDNGDRRYSNGLDNRDTPPPHEQVAKMARYIVRNSNWTSVATISTRSPIKGFPFANVFSVSDGPINNSSGVPYMYLTPLDMSVTDLQGDSRASMTMSLAQTDYCKRQEYDPEDPRCAHVILSGSIRPVTTTNERNFARNALFTKHPEMQDWPKDHGWFFAKLDIRNIIVLDYFGGAKSVSLNDYFHASSL